MDNVSGLGSLLGSVVVALPESDAAGSAPACGGDDSASLESFTVSCLSSVGGCPLATLPFVLVSVCFTGASTGPAPIIEGSSMESAGLGGEIYMLFKKPPGSVSMGWSSWLSHSPSTTNLYLIF